MFQPKLFVITVIYLLILGCTSKNSIKNDGTTENHNKEPIDSLKASIQENVTLKFHDSYSLNDGSILIPVILKETYLDKGETENSYSNILFVQPDQKVKKLDSLHQFFIEDIHIFEVREENDLRYVSGYEVSLVGLSSVLQHYLILRLKASDFKTDTNNLSKTKIKSNVVLASVRTNGNDFKFLSPVNADLKNFSFNSTSGLIITRYAFDTNNNDEWDENDEVQISSSIVGSDVKPIPVIDSLMRTGLLMEYQAKLRTQ